MSGLFLNQVSQEDLEYDGFFDGQNKIIPEGAELSAIVTGGFNGIEEGKAVQSCYINFVISTPASSTTRSTATTPRFTTWTPASATWP